MIKCEIKVLAIFFALFCFKSVGQNGDFVEINGVKWEKTCFNSKKYVDDRDIVQAKSQEEWSDYISKKTPAWCYPGFSATADENAPVFYNRYVISKATEIIPRTHRLPSKSDFEELINSSTDKGEYNAGVHLKSASGWDPQDIYKGDNKSGFNARPTGRITRVNRGKAEYEMSDAIACYWLEYPNINESALIISANYSHAQIAGHVEGGYCIRLIRKSENDLVKYSSIVEKSGVKWASKNVDTDKYMNGDPIPFASTKSEWDNYCRKGIGAYTYLDHEPKKGEIYGKIYNVFAVEDSRGLAAPGWRLPTRDEVSEDRHESTLRTSFYKSGMEGGYRDINEFTVDTEKARFFMECYQDDADQPEYRICIYNLYTTMSRTTGSYTGAYLRLVKD